MPQQIAAHYSVLLQNAYAELVKAGEESVIRAWQFGKVIDAVHSFREYTLEDIACDVGVTAPTISKYKAFYRCFSTSQEAIHKARELHSYDIQVLLGRKDRYSSSVRVSVVNSPKPVAEGRHDLYDLICNNCGGEVACVACGSKDLRRVYRPTKGKKKK